jgi:hypothetical protein
MLPIGAVCGCATLSEKCCQGPLNGAFDCVEWPVKDNVDQIVAESLED